MCQEAAAFIAGKLSQIGEYHKYQLQGFLGECCKANAYLGLIYLKILQK